jgi:hypothetical protein
LRSSFRAGFCDDHLFSCVLLPHTLKAFRNVDPEITGNLRKSTGSQSHSSQSSYPSREGKGPTCKKVLVTGCGRTTGRSLLLNFQLPNSVGNSKI